MLSVRLLSIGLYTRCMVEPSAEEEEYQKTERSTADYANFQKPQKPRNPIWQKLSKYSRKFGIIALALVLVIAVAGGGYWLYNNRKSDNKPAPTNQTAQNTPSAAAQISSETKKFESTNFNLTFDYPANWKPSEDSAEEISVLSTDLKLKGVDGKEVTGQVLFRIQAKGQKLRIGDPGAATAILESKKIAYSSPTQAQRASTYITFVRYAENAEGLDAIYITGDLGYEKDQSVPSSDLQSVDPVVSIEFYLCPDSGCVEVSGVPGVGVQTWEDQNVSIPLENMLKSLVIN